MARFSTFEEIQLHLLDLPAPLLPPLKAHEPSLSNEIAALQLHPTLEAALHLLNLDLANAHFLVRHMQSAPAYEGMYLHGILHRIEGDYENARMWYSDVQECDIYRSIWGGYGKSYKDVQHEDDAGSYSFQGTKESELNAGQRFLNALQIFRESGANDGNQIRLEMQSRRELESIIQWCVDRFGTQTIKDASIAWVKPTQEIKKAGEDQITGNTGRRNFQSS